MVGLPIRIVIRIDDVAESSQLVLEERTALAEAAQKTLHGTMMVVQKERQRTLTSPTNPQLQWVDDEIICILDHDTVL